MVRRKRLTREQIEATKPDWCRGKRPSDLIFEMQVELAKVGRREKSPAEVLTEIQRCLCPRY